MRPARRGAAFVLGGVLLLGALAGLGACAPKPIAVAPPPPTQADERGGVERGPPPCGVVDTTFVHTERGSSCATYEAHVRGGVRACVRECDQPARYREAVEALRRTCRDFCERKGCRGGVYDALATCALGGDCHRETDCPGQCPLIDYCSVEPVPRWNCRCLEL